MRKAIAEKIAGQVAEWGHSGLIGAELSETLKTRYQSDVSIGRVFVRWLGFLAVTMLGMSVLGFIGMSMGEAAQYLAPFVLGGAAYVLWTKGVAMATDPQQQYATSGAVLVTFALLVAVISIVFGLWHEQRLEHDVTRRDVGFGHGF